MKENDTSDKSVEQAIDDIFGTDFIEIDINDKGEKENVTYEDSISFVPLENQVSKDALEVKEPLEEVLIKKEETTPSVDIKKESSDKSFNNGNDNKNKEKKSFLKKNVFAIIVTVCILLCLVVAIVIFNTISNQEKVTNCYYEAEDAGYKTTDEYKITHKKDNVIYVEGKYAYKAKNDEYKGQIEYIKKEKLPVIINSNGMGGFTYLYEVGDDFFSVSSYLDFGLFDYNVIDKNKNEVNPISYVTINSKTTYKSIVKELNDKGYKCVPSK